MIVDTSALLAFFDADEPDHAAVTAILDRFLQHAQIINITGKSYRLRKGNGSDDTPAKEAGGS